MAAFRGFHFKLVVTGKLMHWDRTPAPAFRLAQHMRERGVGDLDDHVEENRLESTILGESRTCFEALETPEEPLATVHELTFDGGHRVHAARGVAGRC
jgi:hypothetical protein